MDFNRGFGLIIDPKFNLWIGTRQWTCLNQFKRFDLFVVKLKAHSDVD